MTRKNASTRCLRECTAEFGSANVCNSGLNNRNNVNFQNTMVDCLTNLLVAQSGCDSYCRRLAPIVPSPCNIESPNWLDYPRVMFVFRLLAQVQIRPECWCNDQTKIVPRMCHRWHQFAKQSKHKDKLELTNSTLSISAEQKNSIQYVHRDVFMCGVVGCVGRMQELHK